jgi:adenylate cyclase, class 2
MAQNNQEIEVKFYIADMPVLQTRLEELGAHLVHGRTHEINLRFDTPEGDLLRQYQVLRLRQDSKARLTYKGPAQTLEGARARQEIEFTVSDFSSARAFLEALGYQVVMMYEKYRTTYEMEGMEILLDEMPYGSFLEIEGPDPAGLHRFAQALQLDWDSAAPDSYTALFENLRARLGFTFRDLSFANLAKLDVTAADLGLRAADKG